VENMNIVTVQLREQKISPKKVRLVMDLIRSKKVDNAIDILNNTNNKSAKLVLALVKSAQAAAKEKNYKSEELMISESLANEGRKLKRIFIKARGRSTRFMKRSSHLKISLCKIEKVKNIKTKESKGKNNG